MRFSFFGIDIYLSPLFFAVTVFMILIDKSSTAPAVILAMLFHETGHISAMKVYSVKVRALGFYPSSIIIKGNSGTTFWEEISIASAGIVFNLAFAITLVIAEMVFGVNLLYYIAANILIAAVNILPAEGLDGGTILKILLRQRVSGWERFYKTLSCFLGCAVIAVSAVFLLKGINNMSALLFGIYIFIAALIKV